MDHSWCDKIENESLENHRYILWASLADFHSKFLLLSEGNDAGDQYSPW